MTEEGYRGQGQPAACPLAHYHSFPQYYLILAQSSICLRISKSVCEDLPCFLHTGLCPSWWNVWWRPKVNLSSMILLSIGSCKPAREGWSRNTASRSRGTPRGQKRRSSHQLCYLHFFSQSLAWVCSPQLAAWCCARHSGFLSGDLCKILQKVPGQIHYCRPCTVRTLRLRIPNLCTMHSAKCIVHSPHYLIYYRARAD